MDWFAAVFNMSGANQLRSVFEEGMLAHQPIDGGLTVGIQIFFCGLALLYGAAFSPQERGGRAEIAFNAAPRFFLNPQDIFAVFPPPGSLGEHSNVLPHVQLKRSTLPWERQPFGWGKDVPWLALLVFHEDEIGTGSSAKLLPKRSHWTNWRAHHMAVMESGGTA
jgi:hypothetical protein